jgi:hypothetical protein
VEDYNGDYYAWLTTTALAIDEGRLSEVNRAQVAEELRDMGRSERRTLRSHIRRVLLHLLKIRLQPEKHTRSWNLSIAESRVRIARELNDSPSLRSEFPLFLLEAYEEARLAAARQTGISLEAFPEQCPFTVEDVLPN